MPVAVPSSPPPVRPARIARSASWGSGDGRNFDEGVLEFAPRLRAFIRRRVRNDAEADDLTQQALLKVYRSRDTLRDGTRLEAWLYQIARATIIDHYRRRRPQEELPAALAEENQDEATALRAPILAAMKRFLEELPATYREPVRLAELEELPLTRIALRLDMSLTAVKSRVRRGRALLKRKLQDCCRFEFDRLGLMIGFERRRSCVATSVLAASNNRVTRRNAACSYSGRGISILAWNWSGSTNASVMSPACAC